MKFENIIFIIYIFISVINSLKDTNPKIAVFPFKTYYFPYESNNEQFSSKDFMERIHSSLIYISTEASKGIRTDKLTPEISSVISNI